MGKLKQKFSALFIVLLVLLATTTACNTFQDWFLGTDSEAVNKSNSVTVDTTISIQDLETATIRIENSGTSINVQGSGTITFNSSGKIITIQNSGTNSKSTIRIESSSTNRSRSSSWENPWDDSRWQDNKVPWLEHTQGYPWFYKKNDPTHVGLFRYLAFFKSNLEFLFHLY